MTAGIYARKSTEQTGVADEAKSVTRQVDQARAYARKKGWTVADAHVYVDDGISGAEFAKRPGLIRLLNALKPTAPFDALIMSEEARLGREAIETAYALKQIITAGARVFFYLEDRERTLESPTDKIMLSLATYADEVERESARQRTYDALSRKARLGHVTGGACFGYENVDVLGRDGGRSHVERRILDPEADVVRRIFACYANGWGLTRIAKTLNAEGAASPRAQQGRPHGWAPSSVRAVLHRPSYRGEVVWNRTKKRDQWGQKRTARRPESEWVRRAAPELRIVSADLARRVDDRREHHRTRALRTSGGRPLGRPPGSGVKYLLTGLVRCAVCGSSFEALSRKHGRRRAFVYGCAAHRRRGAAICGNDLVVPMEIADEAVLKTVEDALLRPEVVQEAITRAETALAAHTSIERRGGLQRELAAVEQELQRLSAAVAAGGDLAAAGGAQGPRNPPRSPPSRARLVGLAPGGVRRREVASPARRTSCGLARSPAPAPGPRAAGAEAADRRAVDL